MWPLLLGPPPPAALLQGGISQPLGCPSCHRLATRGKEMHPSVWAGTGFPRGTQGPLDRPGGVLPVRSRQEKPQASDVEAPL